MDEALEMALSKPIRPHFALAFVSVHVPIEKIHDMVINFQCIIKSLSVRNKYYLVSVYLSNYNQIKSKIGADAILITSAALGVIGVDSITNELEEVS